MRVASKCLWATVAGGTAAAAAAAAPFKSRSRLVAHFSSSPSCLAIVPYKTQKANPSLSQKELSEPPWNCFYNSTVLMARGITDPTTRDLLLTLLDERLTPFGSGCFISSIQSSPFTRFTLPEFIMALRDLLGLSVPGQLATGAFHVHYYGKDRNKPMRLAN